MVLLKKLSLAAATSAATLLAVGTISTTPVQAALFRFSFEGDGASGYFIFDDSAEKTEPIGSGYLGEYDGSVQEYFVSFLTDTGTVVAQGSKESEQNLDTHDQARTIVYLARPGEYGYLGTQEDEFILFIPPAARGQQYGLSTSFSFLEGSFSDSIAQPTSVPSTAKVSVYPYWDFPNTTGDSVLVETVRTRLEKVPEPSSAFVFLGVGAWLIFRRRQRQQLLSAQKR